MRRIARVRPLRPLPLAPALSGTALLALLFLGAGETVAADGVLEINQTCAATGCFAGDAAGYPVTLAASGSYRLTSNLVVSDVNTDAIFVAVSGVGIDLGGFEIQGPVVCSGNPPVCSPASGTGSGIEVPSTSVTDVAVNGGGISGMGSFGVLLGPQADVTRLRLRGNRAGGINVGDGSIVAGVTAAGNGATGIAIGLGSTARDNTSFRNGGDGIFVAPGSTVASNTSYNNAGHGINTGTGCLVRANTLRNNTGSGLNLGTLTGYGENVLSANGATVTSLVGAALVSLGNNACNGTTSCP